MTPMDYCLWGDIKDKSYADKPEALDALKDNIRAAIGVIQLHTIDIALKNWTDRVDLRLIMRSSKTRRKTSSVA